VTGIGYSVLGTGLKYCIPFNLPLSGEKSNVRHQPHQTNPQYPPVAYNLEQETCQQAGENLILMNSNSYFLAIQKIFLAGNKVRKIPTLDSRFFYFSRIVNDTYPIIDAIIY
jgi:hypothetical protein